MREVVPREQVPTNDRPTRSLPAVNAQDEAAVAAQAADDDDDFDNGGMLQYDDGGCEEEQQHAGAEDPSSSRAHEQQQQQQEEVSKGWSVERAGYKQREVSKGICSAPLCPHPLLTHSIHCVASLPQEGREQQQHAGSSDRENEAPAAPGPCEGSGKGGAKAGREAPKKRDRASEHRRHSSMEDMRRRKSLAGG